MANELLRGRQTVFQLTNNSGSSVSAGDLVILDITQASSFTTTTASPQITAYSFLALETIADGALGRVLFVGQADMNLDSAASLGHYVVSSASAGYGTPVSEPHSGIIAQVLETGTTPNVAFMGIPQIGAWNLIQEVVLGGSVASVTFSAIPQTYRSLVINCCVRTGRAAENDEVFVRFNGDTGANYDYIQLYGNISAHGTGGGRAITYANLGQTDGGTARASNFPCFSGSIMYYAETTLEKWLVSPQSGSFGNVNADTDVYAISKRNRWRSTAAITTILLYPANGPNFVSGCRFALYGIL